MFSKTFVIPLVIIYINKILKINIEETIKNVVFLNSFNDLSKSSLSTVIPIDHPVLAIGE